jgi:hypothetical protein
MCFRTDTTFCAMNESRPDVGSSQNMSGGSVSTWRWQQSRHSPEAGNISSCTSMWCAHEIKNDRENLNTKMCPCA